jgi:hypothetical protein
MPDYVFRFFEILDELDTRVEGSYSSIWSLINKILF